MDHDPNIIIKTLIEICIAYCKNENFKELNVHSDDFESMIEYFIKDTATARAKFKEGIKIAKELNLKDFELECKKNFLNSIECKEQIYENDENFNKLFNNILIKIMIVIIHIQAETFDSNKINEKIPLFPYFIHKIYNININTSDFMNFDQTKIDEIFLWNLNKCKKFLKDSDKNILIAISGLTATPLLAVVGVQAIGFTAAGISGGSIAAGMMSGAAIANGGGVAAGGLVATLQTVGAIGMAGAVFPAAVIGGLGFGGFLLYKYIKKSNENKKEK